MTDRTLVPAFAAARGMVLRRTNARATERIYYTLPAKKAGDDPEARRLYYLRRLERKAAKLDGRDQFILARLTEGWLPMWRKRRYRDNQGNKGEVRELCAVPPDYRFRAVKRKPGYPT